MLNRLKNLSEDVAKSFNDLNSGDGNHQQSRRDPLKQLKSESEALTKTTPDAKDLIQPSDEDSDAGKKIASDRNQSDTVDGANSSTELDSSIENLPPRIKAKLKKFNKYEEKYPILLNAFKMEKKKGELITLFEKVLREYTPVSSIADADVLVEYLKGLDEKNRLLTSELARNSKENAALKKSSAELRKKLSDFEENKSLPAGKTIFSADTADAKYGETSIPHKTRDQLNDDAHGVPPKSRDKPVLQSSTFGTDKGSTSTEIDNLKHELQRVTNKLNSEEERNSTLLKANQELQENIENLQMELSLNARKISQLEKANSNLSDANKAEQERKNLYEKQIENLKSEVNELKNIIKELEAKKCSPVPTTAPNDEESKEPQSNGNVSSTNSSSKNSQKKNKKKRNQKTAKSSNEETNNSTLPVSKDAIESSTNVTGSPATRTPGETELEEEKLKFQQKHESFVSEIREVKNKLKSKTEEVEHLRDLLKQVGEDLVEAKTEIKDLKQDLAGKSRELKNISTFEENSNSLRQEVAMLKDQLSTKENLVKSLELHITALKEDLNKSHEKQDELEKLQDKLLHMEDNFSSQKELTETIKKEKEVLHKQLEEKAKSFEKLSKDLENALISNKEAREEKEKLSKKIAELSCKGDTTSFKLEIETLRSTLDNKTKTIEELNGRINELNNEINETRDNCVKLSSSADKLRTENEALLSEKSEFLTKQESILDKYKTLTNESNALRMEKEKIFVDYEKLKSEKDDLLQELNQSRNGTQGLKQQYEEVTMRSKEYISRIENLEDDLNESRKILQERTRESSSIRRLLAEAEERLNEKDRAMEKELKKLKLEKRDLEDNYRSMIKKKQREVDELKSIAHNYLLKIEDLEKRCSELNSMYDEMRQRSNDEAGNKDDGLTEQTQHTIESLRDTLLSYSKEIKQLEKQNGILKQLNEESNLKFERLLKNYKLVTQEYKSINEKHNSFIATRELSESQQEMAHSSRKNSTENNGRDEDNTNVAYLKNVLLGFLEHKDQRDKLLPVVKTLFNFTKEDEKRFLSFV